jgi:hypothetical protein
MGQFGIIPPEPFSTVSSPDFQVKFARAWRASMMWLRKRPWIENEEHPHNPDDGDEELEEADEDEEFDDEDFDEEEEEDLDKENE